ncbi:branched-chain amino acid transporter permease [Flaviflexus massiliensis]|uniref:branched-chain amino acid transporter permease n=1 Tax=Flaviflexus massiliensis TaxID=1522309 RepID=UPI0006D5A333|nr:AzlD domain-containing protein [Flaviflexus massiliensis]
MHLDAGYLAAVFATIFVINFTLRALPFAVLKPLRESEAVTVLAGWMPAGILTILAASTFLSSAEVDGHRLLHAGIATVATIATHLAGGRRTLLSVGAGTLTYVLLVNFL